MKTFWKLILSTLFILIIGYILYRVYDSFIVGGMIRTASFPVIGGTALVLIVVLVLSFLGLKNLWKSASVFLLISALTLGSFSCDKAKSNQQVVISNDYGKTWEVIRIGETVPKGTLTPGYMKVIMPNYAMQGDAIFIVNFKNKVRIKLIMDYDYMIDDPLKFIYAAKFLGKTNQDADSEQAINEQYESAENRVIEKQIKDVVKEATVSEDILELDILEFEAQLLEKLNNRLASIGIKLNLLTIVPDFDVQSREAVDVATAIKIYKGNGLEEVGKQIMVARAGATKITVNSEGKTNHDE